MRGGGDSTAQVTRGVLQHVLYRCIVMQSVAKVYSIETKGRTRDVAAAHVARSECCSVLHVAVSYTLLQSIVECCKDVLL